MSSQFIDIVFHKIYLGLFMDATKMMVRDEWVRMAE
jgi:hypothetical protein